MVTSKTIANGILRALAVITGILLLLFLLYKIQSVILFLFIALIVSMIGNPIVKFLEKRLKFNHIVAVIVTLVFFILLMAGFIMMFVPLIVSQGENLSLLDTARLEADLVDLTERLKSYFSDHNIDIESMVKKSDLTSKLNLNFIPNFINSLVSILGNVGVAIGFCHFYYFFLFERPETLYRQCQEDTSKRTRRQNPEFFQKNKPLVKPLFYWPYRTGNHFIYLLPNRIADFWCRKCIYHRFYHSNSEYHTLYRTAYCHCPGCHIDNAGPHGP
jgi:predicted PurR-regulated permease PerM